MKYGKVVGRGKTATVYELKEGKVLKLFHKDYPKGAVEKEFFNTTVIKDMKFPKPKAYEMVSCDGCLGIIYDKIEGESLLQWVNNTKDAQRCAEYMANLHQLIISNRSDTLPSYKGFLKEGIEKSACNVEKKKEALFQLSQLEDGNNLCHGDFHPGNIFISNDELVVIDFMNLCRGSYLYDIARTVFLIEYAPIPCEINDQEKIMESKKVLADFYLMQMGVTRDKIRDYLKVISVARFGESPDESIVQI